MANTRVLKVQLEVLGRLDEVTNLWIAYHNSGKFPDEFGREFFHAIGKILQGSKVADLKLSHIPTERVSPVVARREKVEKLQKRLKDTGT